MSHPLYDKDDSHAYDEVPVAEEAVENVEVFNANHSAVDHVEKLEEAEGLEENSHVHSFVFVSDRVASDAVRS